MGLLHCTGTPHVAGREMRIACAAVSLALAPGETLRLARARGARLVCRAGTLWVSEYRRGEDCVLLAGESLRVGSDHALVLSGLPRATVDIDNLETPA